ncbi:MAG: metal-dependent transcriptional regulator [Actinobacteria bacterium]|nr:metal-dependent transcriptional regulator [Actinomycetota bacterium]
MSDLIDTTEMYLKAIWELGEDGIPPLRARLTERLEQSGPTVSQTVARMERDGLVALREDRLIDFTRLGAVYAMRVMRKHRLSELLLLEVLGLDFTQVHEEACRWEHVLGREAEARIARIVADPRRDPYGNPVPGLAELGVAGLGLAEPGSDGAGGGHGRAVSEGGARQATVVRIGEALQADTALLALLKESGVLPGVPVAVQPGDGSWRVVPVAVPEGSARVLDLPAGAARHLFVDS